jgi:hypothetical protein
MDTPTSLGAFMIVCPFSHSPDISFYATFISKAIADPEIFSPGRREKEKAVIVFDCGLNSGWFGRWA